MLAKKGLRGAATGRRTYPAPLWLEVLEGRVFFSIAELAEQTPWGRVERPAIRPPAPMILPSASLLADSPAAAAVVGNIQAAGAAGFQIEVEFSDSTLTDTQKAAFTTAAARWQQIITADVPDSTDDDNGRAIDDVRIVATGPAIDGAGGVLGQAGPTQFRTSTVIPKLGVMMFDQADLQQLQASNQLVNVILHEMGHVLGVGTIWGFKNLLTGAGGANPRYSGTAGTTEFNAVFGRTSADVPVENTGGGGTRDSHWREADFDRELMTGFLDSGGANPLSRVTAAQFIDLGYKGVDLNAADPFLPAGGNPAPRITSLSASPSPAVVNTSVTLTANGVTDNDSVRRVRFYIQTNNLPGLQVFSPGGDTFVGEDLDDSDGYSTTVSLSGLAPGTYTFYAQAEDNQRLNGLVASTTLNVVAGLSPAPTGLSLAAGSDTGRSQTDRVTYLNNASREQALQFLVSGTAAGATVEIFADGELVGTAAGGDGETTVDTDGVLALSEGAHVFTARQTLNGLPVSDFTAQVQVSVDTGAPTVNAVAVASSIWSAAFRQFLAANGSTSAGFAVPGGADQLAALPWINLDTFTIQFSEDIAPTQSSLHVNGARTANYSIGSVSYDAQTDTAAWRLAAGIPVADIVRLTLDGNLTDAAGNALDGEWDNGADQFPSGDTVPGGTFSLELDILPADANRSGGAVNASDLVVVRNRVGRTSTAPGSGATAYSAFADINGDGQINATDLVLVRNRVGSALPSVDLIFQRPPALFSQQRIAPPRRGDDLLSLLA